GSDKITGAVALGTIVFLFLRHTFHLVLKPSENFDQLRQFDQFDQFDQLRQFSCTFLVNLNLFLNLNILVKPLITKNKNNTNKDRHILCRVVNTVFNKILTPSSAQKAGPQPATNIQKKKMNIMLHVSRNLFREENIKAYSNAKIKNGTTTHRPVK
ncbi:MAG: hypothetical protein HQK53_20090, partial [Oligoflexia bacterium]|nr:hypothetical protein [Oligoflexia bacterium]